MPSSTLAEQKSRGAGIVLGEGADGELTDLIEGFTADHIP